MMYDLLQVLFFIRIGFIYNGESRYYKKKWVKEMSNVLKTVMALMIILFGGVLLLENLDLYTFNLDDVFPYLLAGFLLLIGLYLFLKGLQGFSGLFTGVFLAVYGALVLLGQQNIIDFEFDDVFDLWPLILIFIGLSLLGVTAKVKEKMWKRKAKQQTTHQVKYSIGEDHQTGQWHVKPTHRSNLFGQQSFDFTDAILDEGETPFTLNGLAGEIVIILPDTLAVNLYAEVKAGEISLFQQKTEGINKEMGYETDNYNQSTHKLKLDIRLTSGSIRIIQA
jgi:lia operon protein LiaF